MKKMENQIKVYENIDIDNQSGKDIVIKKIKPNEKKFYDMVSKINSLDCVFLPIKIEKGIARYSFLKEGNIFRKRDKNLWVEAVKSIAKIGEIPGVEKKLLIPMEDKKKYYEVIESVEQISKKLKIKIKQENLNFVKAMVKKINLSESFTHDDMISLNILVDKGKIRIIDWEHVKISFKENDIGRFLGDLDGFKEDSTKRHYPTSWLEDLENAYLDERIKINSNCNTEDILNKVRFSQMWNYLKTIKSILKNNKQEVVHSKWLLANVEAFNNININQ